MLSTPRRTTPATAPPLPQHQPNPKQVLSVFVERGEDLDQLQAAPLLEGLRGVHKAACYFLTLPLTLTLSLSLT